jgi:DNA-binding CsgD family transcriptional regulator/PAS domain-containing protein
MTEHDDIILALGRAAIEPTYWARAISALSKSGGGAGGLVGIWRKSSSSLQFLGMSGSLAPRSQAIFRDRLSLDDPLCSMLDRDPVGVWRASSLDPDFISSGASFCGCWLAARGVRHFLGARVWDTDEHYALLWLCRAIDQAPFDGKDIAALEWLTPYISNAAALTARLREATLSARALEAVSRRANPAYVITDASGRLLDANDAARRFLIQADGLTLDSRQLAASRHFETAKLRAEIQSAALTHASDLTIGNRVMLLARPSGLSPYIISISGFRGGELFSTQTDLPLALICIVDQARIGNAGVDDLRRLFSLTPAEARLAAALVQGKRLPEIAAEFSVKMSTLRTQLASILRKLDVKRQSDIVRIAWSIPSVGPSRLHSNENDVGTAA